MNATQSAPALDLLPAPPLGKTGWPWTVAGRQLADMAPNGRPWPRVTLVTPSFNQGQYLEETIRSVLLQGYPNLQYMVTDGGSSDNSVEIIRKYEAFLDYWVSEKDRGQTDAINKGLARASGQVLGYLNSDDVLAPRALERGVRARLEDPAIRITCGFRQMIDGASRVTRDWVVPRVSNFDLQRSCFIAQETVTWDREVYERIGPLDESLSYVMDYEYWQRMMAHGYTFTLLPYFLGYFRIHESSKWSTMDEVRKREMRRVYSKYLGRDTDGEELWGETTLGTRFRIIWELDSLKLFHCPPIARVLLRLLEPAGRMHRAYLRVSGAHFAPWGMGRPR